MTLEQIDLIVRRANPVPDASMLEPVDAPALLDQHRRTDMETLERTATPEQPDKQRRAAWLADASATLVTAQGFFDALAAYDSAAAEAYLSPDVLARTYRGADGLRLQL